MSDQPVMYSFRRCPYAIRARLALVASCRTVEIREVVLRDKPEAFLRTSPSATVPCLKLGESVLDESLDIMLWALRRNDPGKWLSPETGNEADMLDLVAECDGPFKQHLDRYKYDTRYEGVSRQAERSAGSGFLERLETRLVGSSWLFGSNAALADYAILPFVRQFANTDRDWFEAQGWQALKTWLANFEESTLFQSVMKKRPKWREGDPPVVFPDA